MKYSMRSAALLITVALTLVMGSYAHADRPITGYEWLPADYLNEIDDAPTGHRSNIIFLNRCVGGCVIKSGGQDSRTNRTFIGRPGTISEWGKGDEQWEDLVACVKAVYDPYDFVITDVDPGPDVEHFEAIVAGRPGDIGINSQVGGIAPFSCGVVNNAITFSFANSPSYANGIVSLCETVAQETAHSFGLEHEFLCTDPMTYLQPCGPKWFQDENASCGEYSAASCDCRSSQNSHRIIGDHFGAGDNPGPNLTFERPLPNSNVEPGFVIELGGGDYFYGVEDLEILINGEVVAGGGTPPYIFNAPDGYSGLITLEARATDIRGYQGGVVAEVNVGSACKAGECSDGRVCYKSFCIAGSSAEGGFGATCASDADCDSSVCGKDSEGVGNCTNVCELGQGECPSEFGCTKAGDSNVCWAGVTEDSGGCGCSTGAGGSGFAGLFFVFLALTVGRRRRQRA